MAKSTLTEEQHEEVAMLVAKGYSIIQIMEETGLTKSKVETARNKMIASGAVKRNEVKLALTERRTNNHSIFNTGAVLEASYKRMVDLRDNPLNGKAVLRDKVMVEEAINKLAISAANVKQKAFEQLLGIYLHATMEILEQYEPEIRKQILERFADRGLDELAEQLLSIGKESQGR